MKRFVSIMCMTSLLAAIAFAQEDYSKFIKKKDTAKQSYFQRFLTAFKQQPFDGSPPPPGYAQQVRERRGRKGGYSGLGVVGYPLGTGGYLSADRQSYSTAAGDVMCGCSTAAPAATPVHPAEQGGS